MLSTKDLYNEMNKEFMGHGIDCIIIQPPSPLLENPSQEAQFVHDMWRQMALEKLHNEAQIVEAMFVWDKKK